MILFKMQDHILGEEGERSGGQEVGVGGGGGGGSCQL